MRTYKTIYGEYKNEDEFVSSVLLKNIYIDFSDKKKLIEETIPDIKKLWSSETRRILQEERDQKIDELLDDTDNS